MITSACNIFDCENCIHRQRGRCLGCGEGNKLRISDGEEPCAAYQCVTSKAITSCKDCTDTVCNLPRIVERVCPVRADFEKKRCYVRKLSHGIKERQFGVEKQVSSLDVSDKTVDRLRWYLFALDEYLANDVLRVSSEDISRHVGIKDYLIRRDLNQFGGFGRPSRGYDVAFLRHRLAHILHLDESKNMIWVGAHRLSSDTQLARRFEDHGFNIVAVFDPSPSEAPKEVIGYEVLPLSNVAGTIRKHNAHGAVLAVAREQAQLVADILIGAGVQGILNLTSAIVVAPPSVCVRNVDIVAELVSLHYHCVQTHKELEVTV